MLLVVISNFFVTLGPRFLEQGIDALRQHEPFREVQIAVGLLLAVALAGGVARYGMRQLLNSGSRRVETDLRDRLYRHLQRMSAEFYDRYPTGDVMARTTNDLLAVRMVAGPALMYLVDTSIRTLLIAPAMLSISPRLTLLAFLPLLGLPVIMITLGGLVHRRSQAIQAHFSVLTSHAHENLSGVRVVRAYRQEAAETGPLPGAERGVPAAEPEPGPGAGTLLPPAHHHGRAQRGGGAVRRRASRSWPVR